MAMQTGSGAAARSTINVTPLIDVLLVLLIIFMVIQPTLVRGLEAVAPQPSMDKNAEPNPQTIVLQVNADVHLRPGYAINGSTVPLPELSNHLRSILSVRQSKVVFVQGDSALDYAAIAPAVDAAQRAGAQSIGMLTPRTLQACSPHRQC